MKTFNLQEVEIREVRFWLTAEHVLLTGSRSWTAAATDQLRKDLGYVMLRSLHHGDARGADRLVSAMCVEVGFVAPDEVYAHPADWDRLGKRAGFIRNAEMVRLACTIGAVVLACWDGKSRGTADTIEKALTAGRRVMVARMDGAEVSYHRAVLP